MVTCSNLKIKAYGKINLALDIVGKRDDGYHMLNTVMQSVSCFDLLDFTLSEGEGIELTCKLDSFPKGEDNIITKAYHAFADFTHIDFGCMWRKTSPHKPAWAEEVQTPPLPLEPWTSCLIQGSPMNSSAP